MRRILGLHDKGDDVALIQDKLNDLMPFAKPAPRTLAVGTIWEQEAAQRALVASAVCPLNGPFDIPSWGTVRQWTDLNYDWGYGGLAAARTADGRMPPARLTGDVEPHNYQRMDADGDYGPGTVEVVKKFQRLSGLPADGIFGPATWEALVPMSIYSVLTPKNQSGKTWVWRKGDDPIGSSFGQQCYDEIPVKPGQATPPGPGYHMEKKDDDDAGVKVEVQGGMQSGDARYFLLGQVIFVRPKGPGDYLGFLPGHTEIGMGAQMNVGDSVQIFVSLTRADLYKVTGKYVGFSVDAVLQPYIQLRTTSTGHGGAGVQAGVTANLNLTPLVQKLLGEKTSMDASIFGQIAGQGAFGLDPDGTGSWGVTLPWMIGLKVNKSF